MIEAPERTRILDAALFIGAGIVAACQVGKAFIAMPLILAAISSGALPLSRNDTAAQSRVS